MTVYQTPTRPSGSTNQIEIRNIQMPYPIDKETYDKLRKIEVSFYNAYKHTYKN